MQNVMHKQYLNVRKLISRTLILLFVVSSLTACGFHLRGNIPLPESLKLMFVDANDGPFKEKLEEVLVKGGVTLTERRNAAPVTLKINQSVVDRTIGTLDERGKASSYNLNYKVNYALQAEDGTVIRTSFLTETRRYDFDPDLVLETEAEEEELIEDMEESLVLRVLRQLSTVSYKESAITPAVN